MKGLSEKLYRISETDNVAVALANLPEGPTKVQNAGDLVLLERIPFGHNAALTDIRSGDRIVKNGVPIGEATGDIARGEMVHFHNCRSFCGKAGAAQRTEISS